MKRKRLALGLSIGVATFAMWFVLLAIADVYMHHRLAGAMGYNVWGYRGPAVGRKKPGELRVVFLGGSTAYGYGVAWNETIPAYLEQDLARRRSSPVSVVNLGYNNEGAYSFAFTLDDYRYLNYDVVCLYEGYNDIAGIQNRSVFRRTSAVFRLTGYMPILQIALPEKAAALWYGDTAALYQGDGKTAFRPSLVKRTLAGAMYATNEVGRAFESQLGRLAPLPAVRTTDAATACRQPWGAYCGSMFAAVDKALAHGARVVVITQPYMIRPAREHHIDQQHALAEVLGQRYGNNPRVVYADLGTAIDLQDPSVSSDHSHLGPASNKALADRLVEPVLRATEAP
jgi:hypothetical protein